MRVKVVRTPGELRDEIGCEPQRDRSADEAHGDQRPSDVEPGATLVPPGRSHRAAIVPRTVHAFFESRILSPLRGDNMEELRDPVSLGWWQVAAYVAEARHVAFLTT